MEFEQKSFKEVCYIEFEQKYLNEDLTLLKITCENEKFYKSISLAYEAFKTLRINNKINYYKYKVYCRVLNDFTYEQMLSFERLQDREYYEFLEKYLESDVVNKKLDKKLSN